MELSPFQRLAAFAAVVIVLAGLGVYLFLPSALGAGGGKPDPDGSPAAPGSSSPARAGPSGQPAPSGPAGSVSPAASGLPGRTAPDIYQWLPFTSSGLASAAQVAITFGVDYGTFSYNQTTAAYLTPMRPLITSQLYQLLGRAYAAPGVAAIRASQKQVASGTAVIASLRAFGSSSITFVMVLTEHLIDSKGTSQQATDFAVTLTGSGTSWQVSDIELASAGNF